MPFTTSVAGPSRLPFQAAARPARRVLTRAYASSPASDPVQQDAGAEADSAFTDADAINDKDSKAAKAKEKAMWGSGEGYIRWLRTEGARYKHVNKGQKANWLGGAVPFATNPTFRPPPPLSNDLQTLLHADVVKGTKTVGQLAEQYNVSKARIEAIRKLKAVEREFQRQDLPLQHAFQSGMEALLDTRSPINKKTMSIDAVLERTEATARELHPSTGVERDEEQRWDANIGQGGAFGDRAAQDGREGIERTVWEFRDEEMVLAERVEERAARESAKSKGGVAELVAEADAAPETPEHAHQHAQAVRKTKRESPSITVPSGTKSPFRFVDTSGAAPKVQGKRGDRKRR